MFPVSHEFSLSLLSFSFLPLSLRLLRPSIIHEVQRRERVSETRRPKGVEESKKKGGKGGDEESRDT